MLSTNFLHSYPGPCVVLASFAIAIGSQIGEPTYLYADAFWGWWVVVGKPRAPHTVGRKTVAQAAFGCMHV